MRDKIQQNKLLCGILIVEIIILVVMGMSLLLRKQYYRDFTKEEMNFSYEMPELVTYDEDENPVIVSDNWYPEADAWKITGISLQPGRYRLVIDYVAKDTISYDNWISLFDLHSRNYLEQEKIRFYNGSTIIEKEFELKSIAQNLELVIHYGGFGTLGIKGIRIEENMMARLGEWLSLLMIFSVFDVFYVLFFCRSLLGVSEEKRWRTFLLTLTVIFASVPMFKEVLSSGHDLYFHIGRIQGIADGIRDGQFPVRIYSTANNGYGYACSLFYGEILLYFPAVLYLLGMSLTRAYQIYIIAMNIGTAVLSYWCFSRMLRDKRAGMLGSFLYTCAAYRIINMTRRAAVGEFSAMMFLPLILYAMWIMVSEKSGKSERRRAWIYLAFGVSGLIQTHILTLQMVLLFLILFCLVKWKQILQKQNLFTIGKAILLTVALNLWFLIPFLQYYGGEYNVNTGNGNYLDSSTLYLPQIFGVFFSYEGINVKNGMVDEMPLTIGFALTLGALGFLSYRVKNGECKEPVYRLGVVTAVLGMIAVWLTSVYCPWYILYKWNFPIAKTLTAIQYPWRYLTPATILFVVTSACFASLMRRKYGEKMALACSVLLILVNVLTVGNFYTNYMNGVRDNEYISRSGAEFRLDTLYLPRGMNVDLFDSVDLICGEGVGIEQYHSEQTGVEIRCYNDGGQEQTMTLPLVYYPNYQVKDMMGKVEIGVEKSEDGRVIVSLPPGYEGTISVKFISSLIWRVAEVISLGSLLGIIAYIIRLRKERRSIRNGVVTEKSSNRK